MTERDRQALAIIANAPCDAAMLAERMQIGQGAAREYANHLAHRRLVSKTRILGAFHYEVTDAGRLELGSND